MQPLTCFFKLTQSLTVSTVQLLHTVIEKGGNPERKLYPLPNGLRNPYGNLKTENSQDNAQKPQRNCRFINWASNLSSYKIEIWWFYISFRFLAVNHPVLVLIVGCAL
jgi:hypothetical protein